MSIRITVLTLVVLFLAGYAWKNWFNALLGGIVLFAFLEHPDMPRHLAGVPGLNLWNILFLSISLAWLSQRAEEGNEWDFPSGVKTALLLYVAVIVVSFLRAFVDPTPYYSGTRVDLTNDYLLNPLKFLLPALMLYDGCRTRNRVLIALAAILSVYFILALLSLKSMGLHFDMSVSELNKTAARRLPRDVGYNRVDLSMMLAGASWAVIAFSTYFKRWSIKLMLCGASGVILLGQAVTGGRTGYVTWGLIGLTLCVVRWRKMLPLIPLAMIAVLIFVPAVRERMLQGFSKAEGGIVSNTESSEITSGRTDVWPKVIEVIRSSPLVGFGRIGMIRSGLDLWALENLGESLGHPHNAYLEFLLDNGILGFLCGMPIYGLHIRRNLQLFRDQDDVLYGVVGGASLALVMALLIAGIGAQTFYPREGVVPMWAALAVALRLSVQRQFADAGGPLYEAGWEEEVDEDHPAETPGRYDSTYGLADPLM